MKTYYHWLKEGKIVGTVSCEGNDSPGEIPGCTLVPGIPEATLENYVAPPPPIEELRVTAKQRITRARNTEEVTGFLAYGKWFDSDKSAIQRISVAAQAAQVVGETFSIEWTCADNSTITLDYAQMLALPAIMAQAANTLHIKARDLKAQIELANSIEELNLITW